MTQRQSWLLGDLRRLHRWRWLWTASVALPLVAGIAEIVPADGSLLHVVLGVLFLITSLAWGLQAWGGFHYKPDSSAEARTEAEQREEWEALGFGETPEEELPAEGRASGSRASDGRGA